MTENNKEIKVYLSEDKEYKEFDNIHVVENDFVTEYFPIDHGRLCFSDGTRIGFNFSAEKSERLFLIDKGNAYSEIAKTKDGMPVFILDKEKISWHAFEDC